MLIFFLEKTETPNGYFILPLNIEHKSEIKADEVGPAPAPSPCRTDLPIGCPSTIMALRTPLILAICPVVEALLAGNSVVLKPSEITPMTGNKTHRLFLDGGVHESVFQIIQGYGDIGSKLVESPQTDVICFTLLYFS